MAVIVNLDKLVGATLHSLGNTVGYRKVSGESGIMNSPNNIRGIWLTNEGTYIRYYIRDDSIEMFDNNAIFKDYNWKAVYPKIFSKLRDIGDGGSLTALLSAYNNEVVLKGTGIGAVDKPLVCSNLEELYIDPIFFLSEDISRNRYFEEVARYYMQGKGGRVEDKYMLALVKHAVGEDWHTKFGRLKEVQAIGNLDKCIKNSKKQGNKMTLRTIPTWSSINGNFEHLVSKGNNIVSIPMQLKGNRNKFITRPGIYEFDKNELQTLGKREETETEVPNKW